MSKKMTTVRRGQYPRQNLEQAECRDRADCAAGGSTSGSRRTLVRSVIVWSVIARLPHCSSGWAPESYPGHHGSGHPTCQTSFTRIAQAVGAARKPSRSHRGRRAGSADQRSVSWPAEAASPTAPGPPH